MFELGEHLLDRIEIGRVRRQEEQMRSDGAYGLSHGLTLVAAEVIEDDDIAGFERRSQLRLDVQQEAIAVNRAVEHEWSVYAIMAQGGEEGHGFPVTERSFGLEPLALGAPSPQRSHVGFSPGLVDKDQPRRIKPGLVLLPPGAVAGDVRPILFAGQNAFF